MDNSTKCPLCEEPVTTTKFDGFCSEECKTIRRSIDHVRRIRKLKK